MEAASPALEGKHTGWNKGTHHPWEDSSQEEPLGFMEEVRCQLGLEPKGPVLWD